MSERNWFLGKTAIVTGSSRAIGRQIALTLAEHGADVAVNYLHDETAAQNVAEMIRQLGRQSLAVQADVSRPEEVQRMIEETFGSFGRIDILVNSAGPFLMSRIAETTVDDWHTMMDGNLNSAFYCTKAVLPVMRRQGHGHLIFLGACKADTTRARPNGIAYGIAKTGVVILAKTLAREEGPNGIRANVVNPGVILTGNPTDEVMKKYAPQVAAGELGSPQDVANAVLYLLSPLGSYCNGSVLNVDGGLWL